MVASIKPVHSLVAGVMQGIAEPVLLVRGTGPEHSYSLRPSQARALDRADVVFWVGETMETFLIKPLQALSGDAKVIELWEVPGLTLLPTREGGMWEAHDRGNERANADADHEAAEDHAHGETDMHVWLDPETPMCWCPPSRPRSATPVQGMPQPTKPMLRVCTSSSISLIVLWKRNSGPLRVVRTSCSTMPIGISSTGTD